MDESTARSALLQLFREHYGDEDTPDEKLLATDPNDFDRDPGPFYEELIDAFDLYDALDESEDASFEGLGGSLGQTAAFIARHGSEPAEAADAELVEHTILFFQNVAPNAARGLGDAVHAAMSSMEMMDRAVFRALRAAAEQAEAEGSVRAALETGRASGYPELPAERLADVCAAMRAYPERLELT